MEYEKAKINRLIDYKDKIIDDNIKNDLEWILGQYNDYYINNKEYKTREFEYNEMLKKYYDVEDEKKFLKERLQKIKHKYIVLRRIYRELEVKYKDCCKKLKSMI